MQRFAALILAVCFMLCVSAFGCARNRNALDTGVIIPVDTPKPTVHTQTVPPAETPPAETEFTSPTETPTGVFITPTPTLIADITPAPTDTPTPALTPAPTDTPTPAPTPAPTDTPTPARTSAPTGTPTPAPTATPAPTQSGLRFVENASLPLPSLNENVPFGQPFCFGGVVRSDLPILTITAVISDSSGSVIKESVAFPSTENRTYVELVDPTFPASGNASLTAKVKFETLPVGTYTFKLFVSTTEATGVLLKSSSFKVVKSEWIDLISNNFRNNYAAALKFFGSRDEFMFRYKWAEGRQITVDPAWLKTHFTSITSPEGKTWYVHKKAEASFKTAINYMNTTYVRVHGTYDSGVIKLSKLIATFNGLLNTRFVSSREFISHHSFGTAIDLNASMDANRNVLTNRALIRSEVGDCLVYNGIKESGGIKYYDFTYTGNHASTHANVPTTVINYLLYELAFYRAGFGWGYYYDHACDAMHFSLTEMSASVHETSPRALRKVFNYIG